MTQEPWLRGSLTGLHPVIAAVLYSFQHAREDLERWTADLSDEQIWRPVGDVAPVGFHVRHIGGSVERLMTYAAGGQLSDQQLDAMNAEKEPGEPRAELFRRFEDRLGAAEKILRGLAPDSLTEIREIGRKRVQVPLGTLLVHIAEHTQRHVGEAIVTTKLVR